MEGTTFELRQLKSSDVFLMFKILNKIGFTDLKEKLNPETTKSIMETFNQKKNGSSTKDDMIAFVGVNLVTDILEIILENVPKIEQDLYSFLGGLAGKKAKEISDLPMLTFTEMIIAVVQKEEFKDFYKVVSKLFK